MSQIEKPTSKVRKAKPHIVFLYMGVPFEGDPACQRARRTASSSPPAALWAAGHRGSERVQARRVLTVSLISVVCVSGPGLQADGSGGARCEQGAEGESPPAPARR